MSTLRITYPDVVPGRRVLVYGAAGHTGRFVVAELRRRGWNPVRCGRGAQPSLPAAGEQPAAGESRVASVDDPGSLDRALAGTCAVINCAGPFVDTAAPLIAAALRARIPYLDVAAEQPVVRDVFAHFDAPAREAGVAVMPAVAFYGGLADLLVTAAMRDWRDVDDIRVAVALDHWHPTHGTRETGRRNTAQRVVVSGSVLRPVPDPPPACDWDFRLPFGTLPVTAVPLSEIITIASHLRVREMQSFMNLAPLRDLRDPHTPTPRAADERGRSAQTFMMDVRLHRGDERRRLSARGRDIYAITAPLVVEAMERLVTDDRGIRGVVSVGAAFDAREFLASLGADLLLDEAG